MRWLEMMGVWGRGVLRKSRRRLAAMGVMRKRRGRKEGEDEEEAQKEEAVFMDWYRERKWTRDRVTRALRQYGKQFTGQPLNISGWRQMAIGISNRYSNKTFGPGEGEEGDDEEGEDGLVDSIYDLQAGMDHTWRAWFTPGYSDKAIWER